MGELDISWFSRYEKRNLWRDRAIDSYINSLSDKEVKEFIRDSMNGTVPVSLYGKSQVGKTTFLLELIGIKQEFLETIHDILRCGTKEGAPATPTAMIYKRTQEEVFRVHYKSKISICATEEEISNELIHLRKSVEDGTFHHLDEIVIEIPERYFNEYPKINIQICDLPGVDSANEKERPHVEQIIKKFIPLSALILVFQIGSEINSVSDLFSNGVMSETLGWKYRKTPYRLVITKAFTADSVVREIKFDDPFTGKKDIIELYRREANKDANNPENVPEDIKIFPFELGKSLRDLPLKYNGDENRQTVIHSIMDELWSEIYADIKSTAETGNVVQRLSEIPSILKRFIADKQMEKLESEKQFNKIIEESKSELGDLSRNNEISSEKNREIEGSIRRLSEVQIVQTFGHYHGGLIKDEMLRFIGQIKRDFSDRVNKVHEQISLEKIEQWKNETDELFSSIRSKISNIKFNKSFFILGPDQEHKEQLNGHVDILNSKVNNEYNVIIRNLLTTKMEEKGKDQTGIQARFAQNDDRIKTLREKIREQCSNRDSVFGAISQKIESYQSELNNENSFSNFMQKEVVEEKNLLLANLEAKTPVEAFLDIAYTSLIIKEYNRQINFN